jgi:hypothetical protein
MMVRIFPYIIVGFVASAACDTVDSAQYAIPHIRDVDTKAGATVLLGAFFDCRSHAPYEGSAFVQHGKVAMKRITLNRCGNPKEPPTAYWYTSEPGYKGHDEANFSYVSGSLLVVHITVR